MREHQRKRIAVTRPDMQEINIHAIEFRFESAEAH